jgi:hypothetical protein
VSELQWNWEPPRDEDEYRTWTADFAYKGMTFCCLADEVGHEGLSWQVFDDHKRPVAEGDSPSIRAVEEDALLMLDDLKL